MLKNLGARIRTIRKQKGLTLVEIAKRTGIAQATLSRIETGGMMGTVDSHEKIAEVLGIGLPDLYSGVDKRYDQISHITRENERKATHHSKNLQIELLVTESSKKKITPYLVTLEKESQSPVEKLERGVEKFFFILEGEAKARVDQNDYVLKTGETLYFDASLPHQLINEKSKPVRVLAAVSPSKL